MTWARAIFISRTSTFTPLTSHHLSHANLQWRRAVRLLELMWACGGELTPDIVSYNTVIKAAGNAGQIELGFQVR